MIRTDAEEIMRLALKLSERSGNYRLKEDAEIYTQLRQKLESLITEPNDEIESHLKIMEFELTKVLPRIERMDIETMPITYHAKRVKKVLDEIKSIRQLISSEKQQAQEGEKT